MNKKAMEFNFAWLFAIIAGAMILSLAVYAAMRFVHIGETASNTEVTRALTILFNPFETGLAEGKSSVAKFPQEMRIYNSCSETGYFGSQEFASSQKNLGKWSGKGRDIKLSNKYVFSGEMEQGKTFNFFSMPFEMPFKVSELILFSSKGYCLKDAPEEIRDKIEPLNLGNIRFDNCTAKDTEVCFNKRCNISVFGLCERDCESEFDYGYVIKDGRNLYYSGTLLYGAIISDPDIYRCNFKRLMLRIKQISAVYDAQAGIGAGVGCGNSIAANLARLSSAADSATSESLAGILNLKEAARELDAQNSAQGGCEIYG